MAVGKQSEGRVFFPWERRRGVRSLFGRTRGRQVLLALAAIALFVVLHAREQRSAAVRATRAEISDASRAMAAWQADHDHSCPASLADLVTAGYLHEVPRDAWGHALRVTCPGRKDAQGFDVSSDGPDGQPGGMDRVE